MEDKSHTLKDNLTLWEDNLGYAPGSDILMLDEYRGLRLARMWRHVLLLLRKCLSNLDPGKVGIVILQNLPDQGHETPVATSHCLGRVGVGLPCCLCLSFPSISATT